MPSELALSFEKKQKYSCSFLDLPRDCIEEIARNLNPKELAIFGCTCRSLRAVSDTERLWKRLFEKLFPGVSVEGVSFTSWKGLFKLSLDTRTYVFGGIETSRGTSTIECLDPKSKKWEIITSMDSQRQHSGCVRYGSGLLCIGGCDASGKALNACTKYDLQNKKWENVADMTVARSGMACHQIGRRLYVIGGFDGKVNTTTSEYLDADDHQWRLIGLMKHAKSETVSVAKGDHIVVAGGCIDRVPQSTAEVLDTRRGEWVEIEEMKKARAAAGAAVSFRKGINIAVAGGKTSDEKACRDVEVLMGDLETPALLEWVSLPPMREARAAPSVIFIESLLVVVGGRGMNGQALKSCEYYSFVTKKWEYLGNMNKGRTLASLSFREGMLLAVGGSDGMKGITNVEAINMVPVMKKEIPARKYMIYNANSDHPDSEWFDYGMMNRARCGSRVVLA
mmetsp:Transcript_14280/g.36353  ORF Transcript_14280/g.36353 Transcript_14280/m.36353 type:complete len:451 (-) Transcript_14280:306-1658(-)|eukprot:CAMPEP_0113868070 /NCGR_PEP_ID=MMETSP0780_2-20120614/772_1 /TAXON_ID=652834 /ORGANISM="Palpitomonas bilix" /LENGTH=450 /DNA_ID=CAMNT_0000853087 /DNA_START=155 /DNA_END=1507 /DNA_ORIENTATION=+ /assembly_acc=CAM_ASM_000599